MSEQDLISDPHRATRGGVASGPVSDVPPAGYGAWLAWERQRAGLGVTDIAAELRLHPKQVRAIEQEDLARLPEPAYVRGFIRSYARVLNIDPAPILNDLNAKLSPTDASVVDGMAGTGDYSPVRAAARERMSRQLGIGVVVAGLIALGLVGWQASQQTPSIEASPVATIPSEPAAVPAAEIAPAEQSAAAEATASLAESSRADAESTSSDPVPGASEAAPTLTLRFSGQSWVEVTDANGKVVLSQLSSAGAEHAVDGALPLTVVIGDAGKTMVDVRGEAFDLQPFTRNNVARITVN